jgi:DNA-binding MarR family transcriptional regulator
MSDTPTLTAPIIGQAERSLQALLEPKLAAAGITFPQWVVLLTHGRGGGTAGRAAVERQLCDGLKIDRSAAAGVVDGLIAGGLLAAVPGDADTTELTPAGRATFDPVDERVRATAERLFGGFAEQDLATAARVLLEITARAEAIAAEAAA